MSSGPEMLLKAAINAFVPKQTADNITAAIEGMLKDGSLDGIGSLVADIAEIKRSQARIEFGLARIYAALSAEQQVLVRGEGDRLPGDIRKLEPFPSLASSNGPFDVAGPGSSGDASREPDGMGGVHFTAHREVGERFNSVASHERAGEGDYPS